MTGRIVGVDVARCLALVGMMATHIVPGVVDGEVPLLFQAAAGRASALFAVLAGVSLVLVGGRAPLRGRAWSGLAVGTAVRAAAIALLGLALGELDTGIATSSAPMRCSSWSPCRSSRCAADGSWPWSSSGSPSLP